MEAAPGECAPPSTSDETQLGTKMEQLSIQQKQSKYLYLAGLNSEDDNDKLLLQYNYETNQFKKLPIPDSMSILHYMSAMQISDTAIYITGGINSAYNSISQSFQLYNPEANTIENLPNFVQGRYTHQSLIFKNKLFLLGGRFYGSDSESLLSHCEYYDFATSTWTKMAQMNKPRATFFSFVYRDTIWVLGGYSGPYLRTKKIEFYNFEHDYWEYFDVKLNRGVELGCIVSLAPDEFAILGGNLQHGPTMTCHSYNLYLKKYHEMEWMNAPRVLQKGGIYNNVIYQLGGDEKNTAEKYEEHKWVKVESQLSELVNGKLIESIAQSYFTLHIDSDYEYHNKQQSKVNYNYNGKRAVYFGNNEDPFILDIRLDNLELECYSVPMGLQLMANQQGTQLSQFEYFICGGISYSKDTLSRKAFIINLKTMQVKSLPKSNYPRFASTLSMLNQKIYLISGQLHGNDDISIMNNCERFDLQANKWEQIASLNEFKCSASSLVIQNQIYVFGGYIGIGKRSQMIERYNENANKWDIMPVKIRQPNEAFGIMLSQNQQSMLIFGGKVSEKLSDEADYYDLSNGVEQMQYVKEMSGSLNQGRIVPKLFQVNEKEVLILGGRSGIQFKFCEIYNIEQKQLHEGTYTSFLENFDKILYQLSGDATQITYLLL